jgi:signal transduction histidine kinase
VHREDRARAIEEASYVLQHGSEYQSTFRIVRPDGAIRHIASRALVQRDDSGEAVRMVGVNTDITEQVVMESERLQLQEDLAQAQKLESIGRLAGGVAHDFNNMLLVILGRIDLALENPSLTDELHQDFLEIQHAALRAADLTRQLLTYARRQAITPKVIDLNAATNAILSMLRRLIGEDVALHWHPAREVWPMRIDPSQLDQVLTNLCVNARDAMEGSGTITITTHNDTVDHGDGVKTYDEVPEGDYVVLTVADAGCGMDAEELAQIFEPFYTTKAVGKGTGLGLATVYGIVKQNKAHIHVDSEPGSGTTFTLFFPRVEPETSPDRDGGTTAPRAGGNETILLVEDEASILSLARMMLEKLGYTVHATQHPAEARHIALMEADKIQLLVTDMVMPEMGGTELAAAVQSLNPNIKVLFMSGYSPELVQEQNELPDASRYIQKPFRLERFAEEVRRALTG